MQQIEEQGCLTQRSNIERLQELADSTARERVRDLHESELLPATLFVIDKKGGESTWELERGSLARSSSTAVQLFLHPEIALDNLVPTQAIMRIVRETQAEAAALVAPASVSMAALQLADLDHEQSLTSRIERREEGAPTLGKWDFGKVAWAVRLRQVLKAARTGTDGGNESTADATRPVAAAAGARPADPAASRRSQRREMREQLHRTAAPAPSWLQ